MSEDAPKVLEDKRPHITQIFEEGGRLYARTTDVARLPVYIYGPLVNDPEARKNTSFLDYWHGDEFEYARKYYPVYNSSSSKPRKIIIDLPEVIRDRFFLQSRTEAKDGQPSKLRPWWQLAYRGYPLYILGDGTKPNKDGDNENGPNGKFFSAANTDLDNGPVFENPLPPNSIGS